MLKKIGWTFAVDGEVIRGESDTIEDAREAMEMRGYAKGEMPATITERTEEEIAASALDAAAPKPMSSLANLARANDVMFRQLDGLKNEKAILIDDLAAARFEMRVYKVAAEDMDCLLHGLRELVLAWNTEQHALKGAAHVEPPFVDILRGRQTPKALEKRKAQNGSEQKTENAKGTEVGQIAQ